MTDSREKYLANISDREKFIRRQIAFHRNNIKRYKAVINEFVIIIDYGSFKEVVRTEKYHLWCYKQALLDLKSQEIIKRDGESEEK